MKTFVASTALLAATTALATAQTVATPAPMADFVGQPVHVIDGTGPVRIGHIAGADGPDGTVFVAATGFLNGVGQNMVALPAADVRVTPRDGGLLVLAQADLKQTAPLDEDARADGAMAVEQEGSGMTTAAPASTTTVADGTAGEVSPMEMNQGVDAAVETDVPDLDDGTVIANGRTPAIAVIADGEVSTDTEVDMQADAGAGPNTLGIAADALGAAPAVTRAGYDPVLAQDVVLPRLVGQGVFNAQDERIGEIGGVLDGESPQVVLDVGGFLGIGEKEVAVPVDALTFLSGGAELRVYVDATQDQLESLPAYEG